MQVQNNFTYLDMIFRLLFFVLFIPFSTIAQVGIGTTNPSTSSILDVYSKDKGILIPRVDLNNLNTPNPIANPEKSMLVWNTDANGNGNQEGFYYWSGSVWEPLTKENSGSGSSESWSLTGNNISNTNFIGTTNYSSFNTKVNEQLFSSYHPNGGLAIGIKSQANPENSIAIGTKASASSSNQATAVGPESNASGYQSSAFGYQANSTNNNALALGTRSVASSFQSTAIGHNAQATSNNNALAIGTSSTASGQNSTAIGHNASVTQNNAVVVGDINNANVGIGTSTPNKSSKLDVNGGFKLGGKGSVQKNMISFKNGENLGTLNPEGSTILEITIPEKLRPSSTNATLVVTPNNSMNDAIHIAWTKLKSTSVVRIKLVNTSETTFYSPYVVFYITINEF